MSNKKNDKIIENKVALSFREYENKKVLSEMNFEIKVIGNLVADILEEEFGEEFLIKVNEVMDLIDDYQSRSYKKEDSKDKLNTLISVLKEYEPYWAIRLIRAYTLYFHVANVVEHIYRVEDLSPDNNDSLKFTIKSKNNSLHLSD